MLRHFRVGNLPIQGVRSETEALSTSFAIAYRTFDVGLLLTPGPPTRFESACLYIEWCGLFPSLRGSFRIFFIILFVIHQAALEGIGVPFGVGLSWLDRMYVYFQYA